MRPYILALLSCLSSIASANEILHDFDGDKIQEKLVLSNQSSKIFTKGEDQAWIEADYSLPETITALVLEGKDVGLRFVDLNLDGYDDLLLSNDEEFHIYLWNTTVKPNLGWTKGWSQRVRSGKRSGHIKEIPSVVGKRVWVENGTLQIEGSPTAWQARDIIAFDIPAPLSPDEAVKSFQQSPGFNLELIASEPVVVDPIAMEWDAEGHLWVVEMRDYPLGIDGQGKPGGVVKRLKDLDGDGKYETAETFLEGISYPTGVFPWKNGVLITATPEIIYAEDTDGDFKADKIEVLFTGFRPGNQQHLVNGFEWGLDGWVYVANGDSGGTVKSIKTGKELSIQGRDFRFKPETGEMETVSAQTQFGLRRDDWGNWFGNNNSNWIWHVPMPEHYLRRNPKLAIKSVRRPLSTYEDATRVFPISATMERPNQPWALNHVTSACSPILYRDNLFGHDFATSAFISEPVHNLVHREVLFDKGVSFASQRAKEDQKREFLASSDPWFRPTGLKVGPDGALYVADMYRFVVEHPEWISPEMQSRLDVRAGEDKGRIYRVSPQNSGRRAIPNLKQLSTPDLIQAINSPSGWQRDLVMRLLKERSGADFTQQLREFLKLKYSPQVRTQTLATLGYIGGLTEDLLIQSYSDPHPGVRIQALRQTDSYKEKSPTILAAMLKLLEDKDIKVKQQLAFSLGEWPKDQVASALATLAHEIDEDVILALQTSLSPEDPLFLKLKNQSTSKKEEAVTLAVHPSSPDRAAVIAKYAAVSKLSGNVEQGKILYQNLCSICHKLRNTGQDLGPDLGMATTKPVDWLLNAILDPNQVVEARYKAWSLTTKHGETYVGIVAAETVNNLVIRMPGGTEKAILREEIEKLEVLPASLMPTGFESALPPQAMADLVAYLRSK